MSTPTLTVLFTNNSTFADDQVYIGFVPGSSDSGFAIVNTSNGNQIQPLNTGASTYPSAGNWYLLQELSAGVTITHFSGRVYIAYGTPWQVAYSGYEPAQAVTDANLYLRYDKMEMTFNGASTDVANLTSIDYWSIPMTLETSQNGTAVATVTGLDAGVTAQQIFTTLNNLTTPPVSGITGPGGTDGDTMPALIPGKYTQYPNGPAPGTTFARIIGPSSYPPIGALPVTPYDTFKSYLQYLAKTFGPGTAVGSVVAGLGNGKIATIAGNFAGVGPVVPPSGPLSAQAYNLAATIDASLNITLSGTVASGTTNVTMEYKLADLMNPSGIYGGNTPYYFNDSDTSTNPGNNVYGWIGGDFFAGINIGAIGSAVLSAGDGSKPVGQLESSRWFKLPATSFFDKMQPGTTNYNQWAAALLPISQAYNFSYTDRFAPVFASLDPATVDTLTIVLENASVDMG